MKFQTAWMLTVMVEMFAFGCETEGDKQVLQSVARIENLGGSVTIDESRPAKPIRVSLSNTQTADADLMHLKGLASLEMLSLWGTSVTDAGLPHLKGLDSLRALTLTNTVVTDAGLVHLKGLAKLETLILDNTQVTDAGVEHLAELPNITILYLDGTQVTDAGLECLKGLANLKVLHVANTRITDAGLEHLKELNNCHDLQIDHTGVTDAGLKHLTSLTNLETLHLNGTQVTDAGLVHLKRLGSIRCVHVVDTNVTDAGLLHLKDLTTLALLDLSVTRISDAGLQHLKAMANLKTVHLERTQVTDEGVKRIRQALPSVKIVYHGARRPESEPSGLLERKVAAHDLSIQEAHDLIHRAHATVVDVLRGWLRQYNASAGTDRNTQKVMLAIKGLGAFHDRASLEQLKELYGRRSIDPSIRAAAATVIARLASIDDVDLLKDITWDQRLPLTASWRAPGLSVGERNRLLLQKPGFCFARKLLRGDLSPRCEAAAALVRLDNELGWKFLVEQYDLYRLEHSTSLHRNMSPVRRVLEELYHPEIVSALRDRLPAEKNERMRNNITTLIDKMVVNGETLETLKRFAADPSWSQADRRYAAILALGRRGKPDLIPFLESLKPMSARDVPKAQETMFPELVSEVVAEIRRRHWNEDDELADEGDRGSK